MFTAPVDLLIHRVNLAALGETADCELMFAFGHEFLDSELRTPIQGGHGQFCFLLTKDFCYQSCVNVF